MWYEMVYGREVCLDQLETGNFACNSCQHGCSLGYSEDDTFDNFAENARCEWPERRLSLWYTSDWQPIVYFEIDAIVIGDEARRSRHASRLVIRSLSATNCMTSILQEKEAWDSQTISFSEVPVMSVHLGAIIGIDVHNVWDIYSDLTNIKSSDNDLRQALAKQIRDACINVGFFYGIR